jgi:hypothetical protein
MGMSIFIQVAGGSAKMISRHGLLGMRNKIVPPASWKLFMIALLTSSRDIPVVISKRVLPFISFGESAGVESKRRLQNVWQRPSRGTCAH